MKLTPNDIFQAERDAVWPDKAEIEMSQAVFAIVKKEAVILHTSEEVLVTALLNVWSTIAAKSTLEKLPEHPSVLTIILSEKTSRIVRREAADLNIRDSELVAGLLKLWADQPEKVRKDLGDEIKKRRDDERAKDRERSRKANNP